MELHRFVEVYTLSATTLALQPGGFKNVLIFCKIQKEIARDLNVITINYNLWPCVERASYQRSGPNPRRTKPILLLDRDHTEIIFCEHRQHEHRSAYQEIWSNGQLQDATRLCHYASNLQG
jgi:hypothetical protein